MHRKFESITNSRHSEVVARLAKWVSLGSKNPKIGPRGLPDDTEWIAIEKVHGANFQFRSDGLTARVGKRSALLPPDEEFFDHQRIRARYEERILDLHEDLHRGICKDRGARIIYVYGEIYGGYYPGLDNARELDLAVQQTIFYHNDFDFVVFDICVDGTYLDFDQVVNLCEKYSIPYTPVLFRGSLSECLQLDPRFVTKIPELHGNPPIDSNISEGYIIRPNRTVFLGQQRVMIKHKNPKFEEIEMESKGRKLTSVAKKDRIGAGVKLAGLNAIQKELATTFARYFNANRIDTLLSKTGRAYLNYEKNPVSVMNNLVADIYGKEIMPDLCLDGKSRSALIKELYQDGLEDFKLDQPDLMSKLTEEDFRAIRRRMGLYIELIVRAHPVHSKFT